MPVNLPLWIALGVAAPAQAYPTMPQVVPGPFMVTKVVDGESISVEHRIAPQDTNDRPGHSRALVETRKPVQCFGRAASAQAKTILGGQQVYLETDPSQDVVDKYDRTLAYVWVDGRDLFNLDMIANGYAHEYTYDLPYRYRDNFKAAERDARTNNRGLWSPSACP